MTYRIWHQQEHCMWRHDIAKVNEVNVNQLSRLSFSYVAKWDFNILFCVAILLYNDLNGTLNKVMNNFIFDLRFAFLT